MIKRINAAINYAVRGLLYALKKEFSFQVDVAIVLGLLLFGYIARPLSENEVLFLILSGILVLITELQNTSIEVALDKLHPEREERIGRSKDLASAAVLMSYFFVAAVLFVLIVARAT